MVLTNARYVNLKMKISSSTCIICVIADIRKICRTHGNVTQDDACKASCRRGQPACISPKANGAEPHRRQQKNSTRVSPTHDGPLLNSKRLPLSSRSGTPANRQRTHHSTYLTVVLSFQNNRLASRLMFRVAMERECLTTRRVSPNCIVPTLP